MLLQHQIWRGNGQSLKFFSSESACEILLQFDDQFQPGNGQSLKFFSSESACEILLQFDDQFQPNLIGALGALFRR